MPSQTPNLQIDIEKVCGRLLSDAQTRGNKIDDRQVLAVARSVAKLRHQLRNAGCDVVSVNRLKDIPPTLRPSLRKVCVALAELGYDRKNYLRELDRLDSADALDANRRARDWRLASAGHVRPADHGWIEENGY